MRWVIRGADGRSLVLEAADWMMAAGKAIHTWGLSVSGWAACPASGGGMEVVDVRTGESWIVVPEGDEMNAVPPRAPHSTEPPPPRIDPFQRAAEHRTILDESEGPLGPPPDLAARVVDKAREIASTDKGPAAWRAAVEVILTMVPCEAGSALRDEDSALVFVYAQGKGSDGLVGREVPYGRGIAGACLDLGATVRVDDVAVDQRHFHAFDDETGFSTRSILATPVRHGERLFGVLEILNPPGGFKSWHVEVAEIVGRALGAHLDAR